MEWIKDRGWFILNGGMKGDEEGIGRIQVGKLVIDYILAEKEMAERVARLEIGDRVDSDHHPVVVWMKGGDYERKGGGRMKGRVCRGVWDEEGRESFKARLGRVGLRGVVRKKL